MSDELLTRQRYFLEKRQGYADTQAADRAGYSGRPGESAREFLRVARKEVRGETAILEEFLDALEEASLTASDVDSYRKKKLEQAIELADRIREECKYRAEAVEALQAECDRNQSQD